MKGESPAGELSAISTQPIIGSSRDGRARAAIARRFEDLAVWQTARELTKGVYRAMRTQGLKHDAALSYQMKRAAISIGSNIAEGFEHGTRQQNIERCFTAKGSAGELRSQVITARDVGLLSEPAFGWLIAQCESVSRQLHAYIAHLQRSANELPGEKIALRDGRRRPRSSS